MSPPAVRLVFVKIISPNCPPNFRCLVTEIFNNLLYNEAIVGEATVGESEGTVG